MSRLGWGEALRLGRLGGPDERLRWWVTALSAAVAGGILCLGLGVVTVVVAQRQEWVYWSDFALSFVLDDGAWAGIALALGLASLPAVHLAVIASRIGGPDRGRRIGALRAAGATRADLRRVVRAETVTGAAVGSVVGYLIFVAAWWVGQRVTVTTLTDGYDDGGAPTGGFVRREVPLLPTPWADAPAAPLTGHLVLTTALLAVPVVPLLAWAVSSASASRGRGGLPGLRTAETPTTSWASTYLSLAVLLPFAGVGLGYQAGWWEVPSNALAVALLVCPIAGVLLLWSLAPRVGWLLGRGMIRGGPTGVLAGRSMERHPDLSSNLSASLVLLGAVSGGLVMFAAPFAADLRSGHLRVSETGARIPGRTAQQLSYEAPLWAGEVMTAVLVTLALMGVLVVVGELATTRRRAHARMVASGVPRQVVRRALVLETGLPAAVMGVIGALSSVAVGAVLYLVTDDAPSLGAVPWALVVALLVVLAATPFAMALLGTRGLVRPRDLADLRDR